MQKPANIISVLLAIFILSNSVLPTFAFIFIQSLLRIEAANVEFDNPNIVTLSFSKTDLNDSRLIVFKKADEFIYRGSMYDIKQKTAGKDSVFFVCYKDHKEHEHIKKHISRENEKSKHNKPFKITNITHFNLVMPEITDDWAIPECIQTLSSEIQLVDYFTFHEIKSPPPKFLS